MTLIVKHHQPPQAGYGGIVKIIELISRRYYWPKIREDIKPFIQNCERCHGTKVVRQAPYRLLQSNDAPHQPWRSIAMDCITDLPKSNAYDTILVVIDRLTKMNHFLPCLKDLDTRQLAPLFMKGIVRLHGLTQDIISDRGTPFTSDLWKETTKKVGVEPRLRKAFHPQTDGQTEWINSILEQYLRAYIHYEQVVWCGYLPVAEFGYNKRYQERIKSMAFFAN